MNPQRPNELISAYFDGEVTPEERTAVERLLAESEEAQRELSETARLSALLHSFPRESAPVDLAGNIQQQTSQLPLPARAVVAVASTNASSRNAWREWRAALISAVSTAAVLIIVWNQFDVPEPMEHPLASHSPPASDGLEAVMPAPARLASSVASPELGENSDSAEAGVMADAKPVEAQQTFPLQPKAAAIVAADSVAIEQPLLRKKTAALPAPSQNAPGAEVAATSEADLQIPLDQISFDGLNPDLTLPNGDFLNGLKAGAILKYMPQPADPLSNVAVVDLQVVDVDAGLAEIQVVLQKHSIRQFVEGDAYAKREAKEKKLDELVVIWVVAPGEQLANALQDVNQHPDLFPKWSSAPPLQIAMSPANELSDHAKLDSRKETEDKQSVPPAAPQEPMDEMPESQLAVQALAIRNTNRMNAATLNVPRQAMKPQAFHGSGNAKDDKGGFRGRAQTAEPEARSLSQVRSYGRRDGAPANSAQGYEVLRIPSSEMNLASNPFSYQANSSGLTDRYSSEKSMGRVNNGLANNSRPSMAGAGAAMASKAQGPDVPSGAVKMLFVLHPMPAETEAAPLPSKHRD